MASKDSKTKVTRITASEAASVKKPAVKKKATKPSAPKTARKKRNFGILGKIGGYFKGAWQELRQVRWPTRKATWSLTGAVLVFTIFFLIFITALDALFKFMFEQILG